MATKNAFLSLLTATALVTLTSAAQASGFSDAISDNPEIQNTADALEKALESWATSGASTRGASGSLADLLYNSDTLIADAWVITFRRVHDDLVIANAPLEVQSQAKRLLDQVIAATEHIRDPETSRLMNSEDLVPEPEPEADSGPGLIQADGVLVLDANDRIAYQRTTTERDAWNAAEAEVRRILSALADNKKRQQELRGLIDLQDAGTARLQMELDILAESPISHRRDSDMVRIENELGVVQRLNRENRQELEDLEERLPELLGNFADALAREKIAIDTYIASLEATQDRAAQGGQSSEFAEKTLDILRLSSRALEVQLADIQDGEDATQGISDNTPPGVTIVYGEDNLSCNRNACRTLGLVQLSDGAGGTISLSAATNYEWSVDGRLTLNRGEITTDRWNEPIRVDGNEGGGVELSGNGYRALVDDKGLAMGVNYSGTLEYSVTDLSGESAGPEGARQENRFVPAPGKIWTFNSSGVSRLQAVRSVTSPPRTPSLEPLDELGRFIMLLNELGYGEDEDSSSGAVSVSPGRNDQYAFTQGEERTEDGDLLAFAQLLVGDDFDDTDGDTDNDMMPPPGDGMIPPPDDTPTPTITAFDLANGLRLLTVEPVSGEYFLGSRDSPIFGVTFNVDDNGLQSILFDPEGINTEQLDRGTTQLFELDGDTGFQVGRFGDGSLTFPPGSEADPLGLNQGFHYALVPAFVPEFTLTGMLATYNLEGATAPTYFDGSSLPGTFNGQVSVILDVLTWVGIDFTVTMPDATYSFATTGGVGNPAFSSELRLESQDGIISTSNNPLAVEATAGATACPAGGCTADVFGVFGGEELGKLGITYTVGGPDGSPLGGAAVFGRQP